MDLALDHIVHFTDPKLAMNCMKKYGLHVVHGGNHIKWGTYNTLCYFDLTYIEWMGINDISKAGKVDDIGIIKQVYLERNQGDHLISFAMRTSNIEKLSLQLTKKGLKVRGPFIGERILSDGSQIKWKMLFIDNDFQTLPLPFFIEWEESDNERRVALRNRNLIAPHKLGDDLYCSFIGFAVNDLEKTVERWQNVFNLEASETFNSSSLNARCQKLFLNGGDLMFCEPVNKGRVSEVLHHYGERIFLFSCQRDSEEKREIELGNVLYWI
ncbi:VOC family protein [Alkalihalobacterium alkalinitrilicum]|uniref:VOC family protein n=1 Tax=Alkalihalobacterium alkalinitrilicum TaxID=427920 RepID=UPI000994C5D2|nr:VOC family protein [Alkalihalobacterium alkalinitrilicum]